MRIVNRKEALIVKANRARVGNKQVAQSPKDTYRREYEGFVFVIIVLPILFFSLGKFMYLLESL